MRDSTKTLTHPPAAAATLPHLASSANRPDVAPPVLAGSRPRLCHRRFGVRCHRPSSVTHPTSPPRRSLTPVLFALLTVGCSSRPLFIHIFFKIWCSVGSVAVILEEVNLPPASLLSASNLQNHSSYDKNVEQTKYFLSCLQQLCRRKH